ncbi:hypothetical protein P6281_17150 [Mycobacterium sp. 5-140-3-2]|uniref:hypothetical protein n=1 Tax=unclassified Mycobacterium TaxID=2642494 RepID=UPI002D76A2CC|nr:MULTISPECIES: hypothetical protein [unclassified Mycobacterium]WRU80804.1 hypothetical protein P6281_17150 [Mycobacterium sp. 5-140-3-2]WSE43043.1 hypothetical protein QGN28_08970 [Mycobacterium sp. 5-140-3-1]
MTEEGRGGFKPPYLPFATLWNFVGELAAHPLPPAIDRSLMGTKSGSDQVNLMATLRTFGLIDDDRKVQPEFVEFATADEVARKEYLRVLVEKYYADALNVSSQNGTEQQLHECFRDTYGVDGADTRRKAVTFFLHAARRAEIPLSPHFPSTRAGSGSPGQKRKTPKKWTTSSSVGNAAEPRNTSAPLKSEYETSVKLQTGGTMSLTVNVNPLNLRGEDRNFFYEIVDKLADYAEKHQINELDGNTNKNGPSEEGPSGQPSEDGGGVT